MNAMNMFSKRKFFFKDVTYFFVIVLLLTFGLHFVENSHEHPEAVYGIGIDASFHVADIKWWFIILLVTILIFVLLFQRVALGNEFRKVFERRHIFRFRMHTKTQPPRDFIRFALRKGIIQPKLCE